MATKPMTQILNPCQTSKKPLKKTVICQSTACLSKCNITLVELLLLRLAIPTFSKVIINF